MVPAAARRRCHRVRGVTGGGARADQLPRIAARTQGSRYVIVLGLKREAQFARQLRYPGQADPGPREPGAIRGASAAPLLDLDAQLEGSR
jgi:hypothetical protein